MEKANTLRYTAFEGEKLLSAGSLDAVALKVKKRLKGNPSASILIFSDSTGKQMDLDLRQRSARAIEDLPFPKIQRAGVDRSGPSKAWCGIT